MIMHMIPLIFFFRIQDMIKENVTKSKSNDKSITKER